MKPFRSGLLLSVWLVGNTTAGATAPSPSFSQCLKSAARVELSTEPDDVIPEVCIRPDSMTAFVFESGLLAGGVAVQERERFVDVARGDHSLAVFPPLNAQPGEHFRMEVRFADGAAPERAVFDLVVHPAWAARRIEVSRHPRTLKDYQVEKKERDARLRSCETALERLQRGGPGPGLAGLISSGVMAPDSQGVKAQDLSRTTMRLPDNALPVANLISYLTTPPETENWQNLRWVAVAVELQNPGTEPWTPGGAALTAPGGEPRALKLWPPTPVAPGETSHWVTVETQLPAEEARGAHHLSLWDEGGGHPISVDGVTFP